MLAAVTSPQRASGLTQWKFIPCSRKSSPRVSMVSFAQKHLLYCLYLLDLLNQPADWKERVGITTVQKASVRASAGSTQHTSLIYRTSLVYRMRTVGLVAMAAFEPVFLFSSTCRGRAC